MVAATFSPQCRWVTIASLSLFFFFTNLMLHQLFSLDGVNTCVDVKVTKHFIAGVLQKHFPFSWACFMTFVTILDSSSHSLIIQVLTETELCKGSTYFLAFSVIPLRCCTFLAFLILHESVFSENLCRLPWDRILYLVITASSSF